MGRLQRWRLGAQSTTGCEPSAWSTIFTETRTDDGVVEAVAADHGAEHVVAPLGPGRVVAVDPVVAARATPSAAVRT